MTQDSSPRQARDAIERPVGPQPRAEAVAGLLDGRWAVRKQCVWWICTQGDRSAVQALVPLTRDPKRQVRQIASYAVGRSQPDGGLPEAIPLLLERAREGTSPKLRRLAIQMLGHHHAHPDLAGFFRDLLDHERDAKTHRAAGIALWLCKEAAR